MSSAKEIHVVPTNDTHKHVLSTECDCEYSKEYGPSGFIIVHELFGFNHEDIQWRTIDMNKISN